MPVTLIVNNTPFEYPVPGDSPGWGQAASDWATAVTSALTDLQSPNDIPQTTFAIQNNLTSFGDITGLSLNTGQVRAAIIDYSVYRVSTSNPSGHAEAGTMSAVYDNSAAAGSKWIISIGEIEGNSGLVFDITDTGQIQYKSSDIGSAGYSGVMHFRAKTLAQ